MNVKEHIAGKILLVSLLILLMLVAARFINLTVWWNMIKLEIKNNPTTTVSNYNFLGFTEYDVARERLNGLANQKIREITIVSYFDFVHPAVFLIHSRSRNPLVNMGILNLLPGKGFSDCLFFTSEIIQVRANQDDKTDNQAVYYGSSLFPGLYWHLARRISGAGVGDQAGSSSQPISFLLNSIEKADYLKIPYYIYFYFPLLLMLILISFYGKAFCISFFYYLGLFLLFDFRKVLFTVPFSWLIDLFGMNISPAAAAIFAVVLTGIFTACGLSGLFYYIKERKEKFGIIQLTTWGIGLIFFFLLLPLFLRF